MDIFTHLVKQEEQREGSQIMTVEVFSLPECVISCSLRGRRKYFKFCQQIVNHLGEIH